MYIKIMAQKRSNNYARSVRDFVNYLEKENVGKDQDLEFFFDQNSDRVAPEEVIKEIDSNAANLRRAAPKFYTITITPSKLELNALTNGADDLRRFTRNIMNDYVASFNREIQGRPVRVEDIKYYAKIEHQQAFKKNDKRVRENRPFNAKIRQLKTAIRKIEQGTLAGSPEKFYKEIAHLEASAPHKQNGKPIFKGMQRQGNQSHIHIIMSRKDRTNTASLSPGSQYKASEILLNGKLVKRGFNRDKFFSNAEKTFDRTFAYKRNYVERYASKKTFGKDPKMYFATLMGLPASEKAIAFKILRNSGIPNITIPTNKVQLLMSTLNKMKQGVSRGIRSSSIEI